MNYLQEHINEIKQRYGLIKVNAGAAELNPGGPDNRLKNQVPSLMNYNVCCFCHESAKNRPMLSKRRCLQITCYSYKTSL